MTAPDDTTDLFFDAHVTQLTDSAWMVAPTADGASIIFYDQNAMPASRIGRRGEGPGEFEWISYTTVGEDGLITAFDPFRRRATELHRDGRVNRTLSLDHAARNPPVQLDGGWFLIPTAINSSDRAGMPMHLMDPTGALRYSFGSATVPDGVISGRILDRAVRYAGDSTLWVAQRINPILEHWTLGGTLLDTINFQVEWFPRVHPSTVVSARAQPTRLISDLYLHSADRIILLVQAIESPGTSRVESSSGLGASDVSSTRRTYLVVLSQLGELAGYTELPGYFPHFVDQAGKPFLGPPMVVQVTPDSSGGTRLVVSRVAVDMNN